MNLFANTIYQLSDHERGLRYRYGRFVDLVGPGRHRIWSRLWSRERDNLKVVSTLRTKFVCDDLVMLVHQPPLQNVLEFVNLGDKDRALVWRDGRLIHALEPGLHAFLKEPYQLRIEVFNIERNPRFEHEAVDAVLQYPEARALVQVIEVDQSEEALIYRDGSMIERAPPGRYIYWRGSGRIVPFRTDLREQTLDVSGQEIMTRDKVSLRTNLLVNYRIVDALKAFTVVSDPDQALYREAQLALRAALGSRSLDALLTEKEAVGREIQAVIADRAATFGVEVKTVGIKDIILPGDMKLILNQVIEAEKQAQANLIRRREETAAARSQANTARILAENPVLARMKELEALQDILAGSRTTFNFGSGSMTDQVRQLVTEEVTSNGKTEAST